jgi:hypothetical protein
LRKHGKRAIFALALVGAMLGGTAVGHAGRGTIRGGLAPSGSKGKPGTVVSGSCPTPGTHFVAADNTGSSTVSTTYVDVPDMSVTFTAGGTRTFCATATFSAFTFAPAGALLYVQALMDGTVVGAPGEQQFSGDDGLWAVAHAFTFVFPSVAPGAHTIKIQYRSYDGKSVFVHRRSLVVFHH